KATAPRPIKEEAMTMEHQGQAHSAEEPEGAGMREEHHDPVAMTRQMREPWLWTNFTVITLGLWLMASPFTFGYRSAGMMGSDVPSAWVHVAPLIALGFLGWFTARYLAGFQLGYYHTAWDPFFGDSTMRVLHSKVSRMWPISDAGLGAAAYTFEALMGYMGGPSRWRTMPWMVLLFGILVVPLGIVHILLVISMPVVVGYWCTLCLAAATVMLF